MNNLTSVIDMTCVSRHTVSMKRTNLWLKSIQIRKLKKLANETGAPMAVLIRKAIDEFMDRRKPEKEMSDGKGKENLSASNRGSAR